MPVDERSRHALYLKLEEVLGPSEATTLMEHLPPLGWADVATKQDLQHLAGSLKREQQQLERRLETRIEASADRVLATIRAEMVAQTRTFVVALTGSFLTAVGIAIAVARAF